MHDNHEDNHRVGAEHEIAHALAYLANGGEFVRVELDSVGGGQVVIEPWAAREDQIACIKMAGPAADFAYFAAKDGEDEALASEVEGWRWYLTLGHPEDDQDAMRSDEAGALQMGLINFGFAWAAGFYKANRELIAELADELRNSGGLLTHKQVVDLAGGRIAGSDGPEMLRMFAKLEPYRADIDEVHAHIANIHAMTA
jgi:hypothetical protein